MEIIEQKLITSMDDIGRLNIVDFHRCNGSWRNNPIQAARAISNLLSGRAVYSIFQGDLREYPERTDFPDWRHVGSHEELARLFWNLFHASFDGELVFKDMPDFSGVMRLEEPVNEIHFWGDIGQISASTFVIDVLPQVSKGDLWISVLSERTHVVIEFTQDVGAVIRSSMFNVISG